jgi:predicted deacylase
MIHLGMVAGRPTEATPDSRIYASSRWLRAPVGQGGVFYADRPLGAVISAGEAIAHIDDPFTDQRHIVKAESAGTIVGMAVPQVVFSGYALIHVAKN